MSRAARIAAVLLAALLGVTGCAGNSDPSKPAAVRRLPDVTLPALGAGSAIDLGTLKGPVLVNIWASFCPPCQHELPIYAAFARKHAGKVSVIGIDFQDSRKAKALAMLRGARADYPVVSDFEGVTRAFALPKLIMVDATGRITYAEFIEIKSLAQLEKLAATHLKAAA